MKIAVVGGGPSGLYLAYLLKRRRPDHVITVHERNPPDATFGFGVVLADRGLQQLEDADAPSFERLRQQLYWASGQNFTVDGETVPIDRSRAGGAIERLTLLRVLQELCTETGVALRFGDEIADVAALDAQLVVGADGTNSIVRRQFEQGFGTSRRLLTNRFAWYGANRAFDRSHLNFKTILDGRGALVGHYYPYAAGKSTFVMECDEHTWFATGMDAMSDEGRRRFTQGYFAEELGGVDLVGNNSVWRQFAAVTNRQWHHAGRYVLLGDALHAAHFSIGSGTRLALEDAIALADALVASGDDLEAGFDAYVATRRPQRLKLMQAAERSYDWYENIHARIAGTDALGLAEAFLLRTGRLDEARLRRDFPTFVAHLEARRGVAPAHAG